MNATAFSADVAYASGSTNASERTFVPFPFQAELP
jgi:hypothetical protein